MTDNSSVVSSILREIDDILGRIIENVPKSREDVQIIVHQNCVLKSSQ